MAQIRHEPWDEWLVFEASIKERVEYSMGPNKRKMPRVEAELKAERVVVRAIRRMIKAK